MLMPSPAWSSPKKHHTLPPNPPTFKPVLPLLDLPYNVVPTPSQYSQILPILYLFTKRTILALVPLLTSLVKSLTRDHPVYRPVVKVSIAIEVNPWCPPPPPPRCFAQTECFRPPSTNNSLESYFVFRPVFRLLKYYQ